MFLTGLLPLFVLGHFAHHLLTALNTPLLPFIRSDFNLDYTQSALVVSAFSLANGFSQLPAGWLADRINPRLLVVVGITGVAVAAILVGVSHTFLMLLVFMVLMGLMAGGYHPAAAPLVSSSVEPQYRGRALGIHTTGSSVSFFLAPLLGAGIAAAFGWRISYIALAVPVAIFGLVLYRLLAKHTHARRNEPVPANGVIQAPAVPIQWRRLATFLILSILSGALVYTTMYFIPLYFIDQFGVEKQAAASWMSLHYAAGFFGAPLGGYLSDRFGKIRVIIAACVLTGVLLYLFNIAPYGAATGILLFALGMMTFSRIPISESFILSQTTVKNRSTIYGIFYFASQETGAVLAPVVGYLIDRYGFHTTFLVTSSSSVAVALICGAFLWKGRD